MRIVIQRVIQANVKVEEEVVGTIGKGLLVLLGIENDDNSSDIEWLVNKLINLRIFNDKNQVMNLSLNDIKGELLVISQFTLMASTKKGNRPSYVRAARHETAIPLYERFISLSEQKLGKKIAKGVFGADMKVSLTNDGPVTIVIDSKNRE
ncbi:MAG: D-aminoacyl-tRNA deacylase [Flavobacteriaceae bacterium]|jgi:D-tyrosyl-tRNA(Tyr) deacylase|nr:D-tyrosyl-tRNA(Tyr) deacylase [Flavobacteriaceae bacterium]MBT6128319.1 D-tyrosyl-tRNA(Tyr) deacylase [Flavobacteriaceae bacterium]MDG1028433.1 D-aminoacyl-tRNA deacylase [Flavobacteriaceae bacterium]|tara:strand:+ start:42 stop:494 length:453 start_codon:yes stop_codon:yes gene_type:complete